MRILAALTAAAAATAIVATASPANANLLFYGADDLNYDTAHLRWEFSTPGGAYSGGIKQTADPVHRQLGWLKESAAGSTGWGSLGRTAKVAPPTPTGTKCTLRLSLRTETVGRTSTANVEVINPTTWTYLALNKVTVGNNWADVQTTDWYNGPETVYFRVSLFGDSTTKVLLIDDLYWKCAS
ncbi:hypothetical protein [Actinoplanes sp. NPDC051859]|uniref:hypothetical protein n=1 Tax=Actinoplanes sp. NPDC051859 TaxID=3363909 RepID=UPI0037A46FE9